MGERDLTPLHAGGHFFEAPRWRDGRWYVSDFYDGGVSVAAGELMFPNGVVIYCDTQIVAETMGGRLTGFTLAADGTLSDRHVWAQLSPTPDMGPLGEMVSAGGIAPDGIALDAEG